MSRHNNIARGLKFDDGGVETQWEWRENKVNLDTAVLTLNAIYWGLDLSGRCGDTREWPCARDCPPVVSVGGCWQKLWHERVVYSLALLDIIWILCAGLHAVNLKNSPSWFSDCLGRLLYLRSHLVLESVGPVFHQCLSLSAPATVHHTNALLNSKLWKSKLNGVLGYQFNVIVTLGVISLFYEER